MLLRTGGIIGMEALVRWEHPDRGLIPPAEFVPLAEETGLIMPIGYKVLEDACRQTRAWQERYPDASQTMYVNLSAKQFNHPELVEEVAGVLLVTEVNPSVLALEISENVLMSDPQSALDKLRSLRELGARVVVDNFGTAYSSLADLGRLPMDSLNVDRSLIFRLGLGPEDTAIVSAAINLGALFGLGGHGRRRGDGRPARSTAGPGMRHGPGLPSLGTTNQRRGLGVLSGRSPAVTGRTLLQEDGCLAPKTNL